MKKTLIFILTIISIIINACFSYWFLFEYYKSSNITQYQSFLVWSFLIIFYTFVAWINCLFNKKEFKFSFILAAMLHVWLLILTSIAISFWSIIKLFFKKDNSTS